MFGTGLGLGIGMFFGWALVTALREEGFDTFHVPVGQLAVIAVIGAFAGVIAAVFPAAAPRASTPSRRSAPPDTVSP